MVEPQEFLDLAWELSRREDEAAQRSAVSRAYYAAFHHLRGTITASQHDRGGRGGREHQRVAEAVTELDPAAGRLLMQLRLRRNRADYDIEEPLEADMARISCRIAEALLAIS